MGGVCRLLLPARSMEAACVVIGSPGCHRAWFKSQFYPLWNSGRGAGDITFLYFSFPISKMGMIAV